VRPVAPLCAALLLLAAPLAGCTSSERQDVNQTAAPNSPAIDEHTTDAERQKQLVDEMQKQQEKNFDAANGGQAPAAKPAP